MNTSSSCPDEIVALDRSDTLAPQIDEFLVPTGTVYLNGNSLGPLTKRARQRAKEVVEEQWGEDLIASWNSHDWIDLPLITGEKIAKLIGAAAGQVICCDSVSVNLLKVLASSLQMQPSRNLILSQADNFPTDLYVAQGLQSLLGKQRCNLKTVAANQIKDALNTDVAVLLLTEVNFRNGDRHDIKKLTSLAQEQGALVIWDLSHSAGVLQLDLDDWGVDFAVGCGYKYLNGGPGAPAFIYANKRHHASIQQPIQGWMGHAKPFSFDSQHHPASGMAKFLTGTPPILSLATLDSALDIFADLDMRHISKKADDLAELFLDLVKDDEILRGLVLQSEADPARRGAQLAFSHPNAYGICRALNKSGIVVDFRSPDIVRFGFSPLFLRFEDVFQASQVLKKIVEEKTYLADEFSQRLKVT
jgi:kynureninase